MRGQLSGKPRSKGAGDFCVHGRKPGLMPEDARMAFDLVMYSRLSVAHASGMITSACEQIYQIDFMSTCAARLTTFLSACLSACLPACLPVCSPWT